MTTARADGMGGRVVTERVTYQNAAREQIAGKTQGCANKLTTFPAGKVATGKRQRLQTA
jgi:hypothetical protein